MINSALSNKFQKINFFFRTSLTCFVSLTSFVVHAHGVHGVRVTYTELLMVSFSDNLAQLKSSGNAASSEFPLSFWCVKSRAFFAAVYAFLIRFYPSPQQRASFPLARRPYYHRGHN
jgi:hypothetical protein